MTDFSILLLILNFKVLFEWFVYLFQPVTINNYLVALINRNSCLDVTCKLVYVILESIAVSNDIGPFTVEK
jgi:hypothetical protein